MNSGLVVIYGEGRGKSAVAVGNAIQAAGRGREAIVIQFLKGKNEEEVDFLKRLEPDIKLFCFAKAEVSFAELSEEQKQEEILNLKNGFNYGKKVIATGGCDLVVLDEILGLVDLNVITIEEMQQMLSAKPEDMEVICTGRVLNDSIRELTDEIYHIAREK